MNVFSDVLTNLMERNDMDDNELAQLLNVNRTTVTRWRKGIRSPKMEKLSEIASVFNVDPRVFIGKEDNKDVLAIYNQLDQKRQHKVYNFAFHQLEEQNKVISMEEYKNIKLQSILSAGTGIIDLDPEYSEELQYKGYVPEHDLAFRVSGDSMEPLFKDSEIIFVEKTTDIRTGQVIAVQINEEAYIKKVYLEDNCLRLVSLNREYKDIIADDNDDIRIVGRVIL